MIQTSVFMMFQRRRQEDCENENKNSKTVTTNMTRNDINGLQNKVKRATLITIVTKNTTYAR